MTNREIRITLTGIDNASNAIDSVLNSVDRTKDAIDFTAAAAAFETVMRGMERVADGTRGIYDAMDGLVEASFDSAISVRTVFGEGADAILEFGKTADQTAGLSRKAFNELITPIGSVFKNLVGLSDTEAAQWAIDLTERASDLAFVFNTDVNSALAAMTSGIQGQMRPLMQYGIGLNAAMVEAKALEETGKTSAGALTLQEKAMARVSLIMEQTAGVQGSFADNTDLLFNKQQTLTASLENQRAEIGQKLLPVLDKAFDVYNALPGPVQLGAIAVSEFGGSVITTIGGLAQISLGLSRLRETMDVVRAGTASLRTSLGLLTAGLGPVALGVTGIAVAAVALNKAIEGDRTPEWAGALNNIVDPADRLAFAMQQVEGRVGDVTMAEAVLIQELEKAVEAHQQAEEWTSEQAAATDELGNALDEAAEPTITWTDLLDELNDRLDDAAGYAVEAFDAISKWQDVPTVEIIELDLAIRDVERDIRELERAQRSGTEGLDEQLEALNNQRDSLADQREALQDSTSAVVDSTIRQGLYDDSLRDTILSQEDVAEAARNSIEPFLNFSDTLDNQVVPSIYDVIEGARGVYDNPINIQADTSGVDEAEGRMNGLVSWISDTWNSTWEGASGAVNSAWNDVRESAQGIYDSVSESARNTYADVEQWFGNSWESVKTFFSESFNGAVEWGQDFGNEIYEGAQKVPSILWDGLQGGINAIDEFAQGGLDKLAEVFTAENIGYAMGAMLFAPMRLVREGFELVYPVMETFFTETLPNLVTETIPNAIDSGYQWGKSLADSIWENIVSGWDAGKVFFTDTVPTFIIESATEAYNSAKTLGSEIASSIWSGIRDSWDAGKIFLTVEMPNFVGETASEFANKAYSIGAGMVNSIWRGMGDGKDWLISQITSVPGWIVDEFTSQLGEFYDFGRAIVGGIWDGISGGASWLREQAEGFFGGFIRSAKDMLGIGSPSKVMAEIGEFVVQGFINGLLRLPNVLYETGLMAIENFWRGVNEVWNRQVNFFTEIVPNIIRDSFNRVITNAGESGAAVMDRFWNGITNGWNSGRTFFTATLPNTVRDAFNNVLNTTGDSLNRFRDTVRSRIDETVGIIQGRAMSIQNGILGPFRGARSIIGSVIDGFGRNLKWGLNGVINVLNGFTRGFRNAVNWIGNRLNLGNVISGSFDIPHLARGGIVNQTGLAVFGENGPELGILPKGAQVMPHERSVDFLKALSPDKAIGGIPGISDVKNFLTDLPGHAKSGLSEIIKQGVGPLISAAFRAFNVSAPNLGGVMQNFGPKIFQLLRDGLWQIVSDWITGAKEALVGTGILGRPLSSYVVTQEFGMTSFAAAGAYAGAGHSGIDLAAPTGTPIYAADTGRVNQAGWNGGYGNYISIVHNGLRTAYGHLSRIATAVNDIVTKGEMIGAVGSTGYSTGPHLHFETWSDGALMNPRQFVQLKDGTPRIPRDMLAFLHKDEAVLSADLNPFIDMPSQGLQTGFLGNPSRAQHSEPSITVNIENLNARNELEGRNVGDTIAWSTKSALEIRNGLRIG